MSVPYLFRAIIYLSIYLKGRDTARPNVLSISAAATRAANTYCYTRSTRMPTYEATATSSRGYWRSSIEHYTNSHVTGRDTARANVPSTPTAATRAANVTAPGRAHACLRTEPQPHLLEATSGPLPSHIQVRGIPYALGLKLMTRAPATSAAAQCGPPLARNIHAPSPTSTKECRASHASKQRTSAHATLG